MNNLLPPIAPNDRPLLHKIGEYVFQDLTIDLMATEPDLKQARLYGKRGQGQYGGDAVASCIPGGSVVAQCKCYESVLPSDIKNACDEFYRNLGHWKTSHNTRRFILVLACDADSATVVDEIARQRKRLKKKGIAFDTWDRIIIVQKLQPNRRLVNRYLGSGLTWEAMLCGPGAGGDRSWSISSSTSEAELLALQAMLTEHAERDVQNLRDALRRGRRSEVRSKIKSFRDNPTKWALLSARVRAALLRLEAAVELDTSADLPRAKSLIEEARRLDSEISLVRLETRLRLLEFGPAQALEAIPTEDNLETLCARGSALLVLGDTDEAIRTLQAALQRDVKDPDTLRLLAIAYLARGDVKTSLEFLAQVLLVAPDWEVVRHAKAVIYYVSVLSSPDLQNPGSAFPDPLEWSFVRRDTKSLRRLEEADAIFAGLLVDTDRPRGDRQMLEVWRLACLANHADRQKQAAEYCTMLVDQHPCNFFAIPWASARAFPVDFGRATAVALLEADRDPSNLATVLMATAGKLQIKDWAGATAVLEKNRMRFLACAQTELWNYWWAIARVFSGEPEGALDFVRSIEPNQLLSRIEILALRSITQRDGDPGPLLEKLSLLYGQTGNPGFLVELCNQYAIQRNWAALAERSTELLEKVPTADSLYLALIADFNTHREDRCLKRIDEHRDFLAGGLLPLDVRRMRVACLERRGKVAQALAEAEDLRKDDAGIETLVSFISLCMRFGSIPRAVAAGQDLLARQDGDQEARITVAELLMACDPDLSRALWRSTDPVSVPADRIPTALRVGYRLELEREMGNLLQRGIASTIEGEPVLRPVEQEELLELFRREQINQDDLLQLYDRGQIPVHLLADRLRVSLPSLYWHQGEASFTPLSQPHAMVRNGKRGDSTPASNLAPSTRLNLDVTSVLLIHELGLWNPIRSAVAEVRFSGQVIPFLQQTLLWTGSAQPGWQAGQRGVVAMWQQGLVSSDTSDVDCAVEFQPSDAGSTQINLRSVADELRSAGALSAADYEQALDALGSWGKATPSAKMPEGVRKIRCSGSTGVLLAVAGLLRPLASLFVVAMDGDVLFSLREAVKQGSQDADLGVRIKHLIHYLSLELEGERLELIPDSNVDKDFDTPCTRCVADLLLFESTPEDVICVDDRFVSGYIKRDGDVPIVTLYDILPTLVDRASVTQSKAWQLVHEFRRKNLWFIPLQADEIVHHLLAAGVSESGVIETPELRTMRQYFAACMAQSSLLQRGNPVADPNDVGETPFATRSRHAVTEALAMIWGESKQSEHAKLSRSRWILDSLYIDIVGLRRSGGVRGPTAVEENLVGLDAVLLLLSALVRLRSPVEGQEDVWAGYFGWVWNEVFQNRSGFGAEIVNSVAAHLAQLFRSWTHESESRGERVELERLVYRIIYRLPGPLRERLENDRELIADLGVKTMGVTAIRDLLFPTEGFTAAVKTALVKGSAPLESLRTKEQVIIRRLAPGVAHAIDVERPSLRRVDRLQNDFWALLLPSMAERDASLRSNRGLFDVSDEEFELLVNELNSIQNDVYRMERALAAARASTPYFYRVLGNRLLLQEQVAEADLNPVDAEGFLHFHGLKDTVDSHSAIPDALPQAARQLCDRVGWQEALNRLAGLPVSIPAMLESSFADAETEVQKRVVHLILRVSRSPVRRLHVLRLLSTTTGNGPVFARLAKWMARQLLSDRGTDQYDAYTAMLRWVARAFSCWPEGRQWSRSLRSLMAWSHADRLFGLYVERKADLQWVQERFAEGRGHESPLDLEEDIVTGRDAADPTLLDRKSFMLTGFAYALEDASQLAEAIRPNLEGAFFDARYGAPFFSLWETEARLNHLASFLGRDRLRDLEMLLGSDHIAGHTPEWRSKILKEALRSMKSDPHQTNGWFVIAVVFRDLPAPVEVDEAVANCLKRVDFCSSVAQYRGSPERNVLSFLLGRLVRLTDPEARAHIASELIKLAEWYGSNGGDMKEAAALVNLVLTFAYPIPSSNRPIDELQRLSYSMAAAFPEFAKCMRDFIGHLCADLPVLPGAEFWPLMLQLRALE